MVEDCKYIILSITKKTSDIYKCCGVQHKSVRYKITISKFDSSCVFFFFAGHSSHYLRASGTTKVGESMLG